MKKFKRVFVIVMDSFGAGNAKDADEYGDQGADTMGHIAEYVENWKIPNLQKLGLANLHPLKGVEAAEKPIGYYTVLNEMSKGKDTMTGHWELMGIKTTKPFVTFTETGFPPELIAELERRTGRKIIGNKSSSGTEILDELAEECQRILNTEETEKLDELYRLGGTSGGARPKVMMEMDGEPWIIKFPAHVDRADIGKMEYDYYLCAEQCGITMSECNLFPSDKCSGYFGTKRFDRKNQHGEMERVHMLTVAALLELDFEQPVLDYQDLMKLTKIITNNSPEDLENMYRRMCFNVYAHNRDDHAKNFSFLYEEEKKCWRLIPAYDLTYSTTYYGEHTTTVAGNGKNPGSKELIFVGTQAGLSKEKCRSIAVEIKNCVSDMLSEYLNP